MSGLICESCGLPPCVPFGGEEICECPEPSAALDDYGEDWDDAEETDPTIEDGRREDRT